MRIQKWDTKCDDAFKELNNAMTSALIHSSPNGKKPFRGHVDASELVIDGNLTQIDDSGKERLIAFFSRKLSSI